MSDDEKKSEYKKGITNLVFGLVFVFGGGWIVEHGEATGVTGDFAGWYLTGMVTFGTIMFFWGAAQIVKAFNS